MDTSIIMQRGRRLAERPFQGGPIVYWMNRDQRVHDNWALLAAHEWAKKEGVAFAVAHNLLPGFLGGGERQWRFKLAGLRAVQKELHAKGIPFYLFVGEESHQEMLHWMKKEKIGGMVTDFFPLRLPQRWLKEVVDGLSCPVYQVDAHNVVPCWITSQKQEFAARTIRPKIHAQLKTYLTDIPKLASQASHAPFTYQTIDWKALEEFVPAASAPKKVDWIEGGEAPAHKALRRFLSERLPVYHERRNDPLGQALSDLSPFFHYGHLAPQRVAYEALHDTAPKLARDAFIEELVVRRELSDNYCFYQPHYDSFEGLPEWARKTLDAHRKDPREFTYSRAEFEYARTHDELWNAAQLEMVKTGKMHGYVRMYWAKKILEWSDSPEDAFKIAIHLNDRYELDGRDPNGYVGIAWSIGGLHDRPWFNRPIFGSVRYMSRGGMEKKFDVEGYIKKWSGTN